MEVTLTTDEGTTVTFSPFEEGAEDTKVFRIEVSDDYGIAEVDTVSGDTALRRAINTLMETAAEYQNKELTFDFSVTVHARQGFDPDALLDIVDRMVDDIPSENEAVEEATLDRAHERP